METAADQLSLCVAAWVPKYNFCAPASWCAERVAFRRHPGLAIPHSLHCRAVTGNTNTVAGNVPPKANLGDLSGLNAGLGPDTTAMVRAQPELSQSRAAFMLVLHFFEQHLRRLCLGS